MQDNFCPKFARGVRLHRDRVRQQSMLLFPEGALALNATAAAILELCDGTRTIDAIAIELESRYQRTTVREDVRHLLKRIAARGLLIVGH
jgi:pyrroloquinoline quinone biosynthesis protein D